MFEFSINFSKFFKKKSLLSKFLLNMSPKPKFWKRHWIGVGSSGQGKQPPILAESIRPVMARVTRPQTAHCTDCIVRMARRVWSLLQQAFRPENSHLHIANFICNTLCTVALPQANQYRDRKHVWKHILHSTHCWPNMLGQFLGKSCCDDYERAFRW